MINEYFVQIRLQIENYRHIINDFFIEEKAYSEDKGFICGQITFIDLSILQYGEVKHVFYPGKIKYRYHYMNQNRELIFRYDNAKHHPEITTFPHHKHTINKVTDSKEVNISNVLEEIQNMILRNTPDR